MPKGPILDYLVVRDNDHDQFAQKVRAELKNGYECLGKMLTQRASMTVFDYVQNMVKWGPRPVQPAQA